MNGHIEYATHLKVILPRKTSAGLICMLFSVRAIVLMVIPMGVAQFNLFDAFTGEDKE